jgi:competence protein ComEC
MKKNSALIILVILLSLNILAWLAVWELGQERGLEVTFFDVGQGDAIFIETPQNHQILIDGGPDDTVIEKLGKEMPFWDRTIDLIILTHPEHDHISGLIEALKRYKVKNILWTGVIRDTAEYEEWKKLIQKEGANIFIAQSGQQIEGGLTLINILHPLESLEGKKVNNTNNTSIIARLVFGDTSFLFTGDAYQSVERLLLTRSKQQLDSDILKVGHHGSKTSTAPEFVEAVSPEIAVISAGKDNPYGHPHIETIQNLEGIKIFRTDLDGDIKVVSDGIQYKTKND